MTSNTVKLSRKEIIDFLSTTITKETAVILEKKENRDAVMKLLSAKQASLLLERMMQVGKDSEYMFAYDVISGIKDDIIKITKELNKAEVKSKTNEE